jgi:hypothetical protein
MDPRIPAVLIVLILLPVYVLFRYKRSSERQFFPGPRSLPIVGHLYQVPTKYPWLTYAEWGK